MKFIKSGLLIFLLFTAHLGFAQETPFLADRHAKLGLNCSSCHLKEKPGLGDEVQSTTCLQCHKKEELIKKYESRGKQNPHQNHLGDVDCYVCHKGHEKSEAYCLKCHKSNFQMPMK